MDDLISRQAAIAALNEYFSRIGKLKRRGLTKGEKAISLDTVGAIKTLPPANCSEFPNNSDTISRQAAIDVVMECYDNDELFEVYEWKLNELPPIQPRRGKWHYSDGKPARIGLSFGVICDQCGTESEYCTNFCGECGADMREVTE